MKIALLIILCIIAFAVICLVAIGAAALCAIFNDHNKINF